MIHKIYQYGLLFIITLTMSAPAFAVPCFCDHLAMVAQTQEKHTDVVATMPCHGETNSQNAPDHHPSDKKSCCGGASCCLGIPHASLTAPNSQQSTVIYTLVDYAAMPNHIIPDVALLPPYSPPKS